MGRVRSVSSVASAFALMLAGFGCASPANTGRYGAYSDGGGRSLDAPSPADGGVGPGFDSGPGGFDSGPPGFDSGPPGFDSGPGIDAGCLAPAPGSPGFGCGSAALPAPMCSMARVNMTITDSQSGSAIGGASVQACNASDTNCSAPVGGGSSDGSGRLTVTVPTGGSGWFGYFRIQAGGYPVHEFWASLPVLGDEPSPPQLTDSSTLGQVASYLGTSYGQGTILGKAFDCSANAGSGVSFSESGGGTPFYVSGGLPTSGGTTDGTGQWGVMNVNPGMVTITATHGGTPVGAMTVNVKSGVVTAIGMLPTPGGSVVPH